MSVKNKKMLTETPAHRNGKKSGPTEQEKESIWELEDLLRSSGLQNYLEGNTTNFDGALNWVNSNRNELTAEKFALFFKDRLNFTWDDAVRFSTSISPLLVKYFCDNKEAKKVVIPANIRTIYTGSFTQLPLEKVVFKNDAGEINLQNPIFNPSTPLPELKISKFKNFRPDENTAEGKEISEQVAAIRLQNKAKKAAAANGSGTVSGEVEEPAATGASGQNVPAGGGQTPPKAATSVNPEDEVVVKEPAVEVVPNPEGEVQEEQKEED